MSHWDKILKMIGTGAISGFPYRFALKIKAFLSFSKGPDKLWVLSFYVGR